MLDHRLPAIIRGITLFRDYNSNGLFYTTPNSPRLTVEAGQPMFQLLVYRDIGTAASGVQGGGFLIMTTDLGVPAATLEQVNEIGARYGVQATLAPLPVKSGTVRVTILDSGASGTDGTRAIRFVENIGANAAPSLYGEQRAAFTAEFSRQGAVLIKAALRGEGATPVVVVYDLKYVGLLPAYNVKITIEFRQSYEHLRSRTQTNALWFKADIDQEMESLRKSGCDQDRGDGRRRDPDDRGCSGADGRSVNALAKELAQWTLFKPGIESGRGAWRPIAERSQAYEYDQDVSSITAG